MSYSELRSLKVTDISQLSAEELSILDENKRLNQQLQQRPTDVALWVEFMRFQDRVTAANHQSSGAQQDVILAHAKKTQYNRKGTSGA